MVDRPCYPMHPPSAGNSATQLLADQRRCDSTERWMGLLGNHTQPDLIPASNAPQNHLCRRRLTAYAPTFPSSAVRQLRCRPPSRLSFLSEARRSACGTACPHKQTGLRLPSQFTVLPYLSRWGALSRDPVPQVLLARRHCNRPYAAPSLPTLQASPPRG